MLRSSVSTLDKAQLSLNWSHMKKHPQLAKKFQLLYKLRINSAINTNTDLAKRLGIPKQFVSKWVLGTETLTGDNIPIGHIDKVAKLFGIDASWFLFELNDFEVEVQQLAERQRIERNSRPKQISLSLMPLTEAEVFGRESEADLLDAIWEEKETNVLEIVAFGGMGKSSFVNYWLSRMDLYNYRGAKQVYAWSFYWQGSSSDLKASGDFFIEHALLWFGDKNPSAGTPWAKATRLANLIRYSRTLLILDGLEPLQFPPGPKAGQVENPAVALLLKELASDNNGLCVITSRLSATDLSPYRDRRVATLELNKLSMDAGVRLLKNMGVSGKEDEYKQAINEYEGHPFSLSLLAGYLLVAQQGGIRQFRQLQSLLDEQNRGTHAKNLMSAYLKWFEGFPELSLLRLIGLIGRPVALDELKAMAALKNIDGLTSDLEKLTASQWSYAVGGLSEAKLISVDNRQSRCFIDCHPLVRDFIGDYLKTDFNSVWQQGHGLIFDYLLGIVSAEPSTITEMESLFRAVTHGARAGRYEESFQLYFNRIKKGQFSMFTEGPHHADQACIRDFFETEWTRPVDGILESEGFYLMSCAATNLIYLGEIELAIEPSLKSIEWFSQNEMWIEALSAAGPLASMLIAVGRVDESLSLLKSMEECIKNTNSSLIEAIANNFQAYGQFLKGRNSKAKSLFEQAEKEITQLRPESTTPVSTISSYYCKFLLDTGALHQALERSLKTFGWRERKSWQVTIDTTSLLASDLMVLGLVFLRTGDLVNAKVYLDKEVELLKSADEWLYLPTGLNSRALYYIETKNFDAAHEDLEDALSISKRTGAKFGEWETYLNFSQLYIKQGDMQASKSYLGKVKAMSGMDAYRFRDSEIEEIERHLYSAPVLKTSASKSKRRDLP